MRHSVTYKKEAQPNRKKEEVPNNTLFYIVFILHSLKYYLNARIQAPRSLKSREREREREREKERERERQTDRQTERK